MTLEDMSFSQPHFSVLPVPSILMLALAQAVCVREASISK
jgi:hypothetical protein